MSEKQILAIVPARGGSKGIPGKNIIPLAGKPLLAHTLEQAHNSSVITRLTVSTDDQAIAQVAEQHGAEVIWRPADISSDTASSESALIHVLDHLRDSEDYVPELIVFLQCTSPLRRPNDIQNAVQTLCEADADSLLSLAPFNHFLWHRPNDQIRSLNFDYLHRPRHQELPPIYMENGSIYVFKPWVLRETGNRLGGKITHYEMDPLTAIDIDAPDDLALCEAIMTTVW